MDSRKCSLVGRLLAACFMLTAGGCAEFGLPHIDPSGEHLLIFPVAPPAPSTCPPGMVPIAIAPAAPPVAQPVAVTAARPPSPYDDVAVVLTPYRTVAPVGQQVVMVAGVRGGDNYLRTNRRLEWSIDPGSVGQFVALNGATTCDYLVLDFTNPHKVTNIFAVGSTSRVAEQVPGPSPGQFTPVLRGQGWISVVSPIEGISHVTVVAPDVVVPAERVKSAVIYWVDAQYGFPSVAIVPAGSKHVLTTTVQRQSNPCPIANWLVRYEVCCGPAAIFSNDSTAIEVPTNASGQASVEITQPTPAAGTTQVRIQVIRPLNPTSACAERLVVRDNASALVTWSSATLAIQQAAPATAVVGANITYRVQVANSGDLVAKDLVASARVPDGLSFVGANPAAVAEGRRLRWQLGDLGPQQSRILDVTYRADQPGAATHCVEAAAGNGLAANQCVSTTILAAVAPVAPAAPAAPTIEATMSGPDRVNVGDMANFAVTITNRGPGPAEGLTIQDFFQSGLESEGGLSPIRRSLNVIAPGQTVQIGLPFHVTQAGQLCHDVVVLSPNGSKVTAHGCVTAIPLPTEPAPRVPQPFAPPAGGSTAVAPPSTSVANSVRLEVAGPAEAAQYSQAKFNVLVTNTGREALVGVKVSIQVDAVLNPVQASDGRDRDAGNRLIWTIPTLGPGEARRFDLVAQCIQPSPSAALRVTAQTSSTDRLDKDFFVAIRAAAAPAPNPGGGTIAVPPPGPTTGSASGATSGPATGGLTVDIDDIKQAIAGEPETFLVKINTTASQGQNDVVLAVTIPQGTTVDPNASNTSGPTDNIHFQITGGLLVFDAVPHVDPGQQLNYHVTLSTSQAGPLTLRCAANSREQTQATIQTKTVQIPSQ